MAALGREDLTPENVYVMIITLEKIVQHLLAIAMEEVNVHSTKNVYATMDSTVNIVKKVYAKIIAI